MPDGRGPVRHSVFKAPFVDSRQNGLIEQELKTLSASPLSHIECGTLPIGRRERRERHVYVLGIALLPGEIAPV